MISLVLFFPTLPRSPDLQSCVKQYLIVHDEQFQEPPRLLLPCTFYIFNKKKKQQQHMPTKFVIFVLWPISCRGAWQHQHSTVLSWSKFQGKKQNKTPFHPSQHVVLLPLVYSLFRPGHESWIWLATRRCGMTSDRAGAHGSGSICENCVDHKPINWDCQFLFFFSRFYLKKRKFLSV